MKTQIAAIEFGTSKIVTVIAQSGGIDRLDIIGSGTVPYDGYMDGDWNNPGQMIQRVSDSIAAAEIEANSKIREIYVGVPGEYVHVRICDAEIDLPDGTVDEGFSGEICVCLFNLSDAGYYIERGDKVAQLIVTPCQYVPVEPVDEIHGGERGENGFGSTGR